MTEDQVVRILSQHFESLFPKVCPNCKHRFATLREYIRTTTRVGPPVSYDADLGNWAPKELIGTLVLANCTCGNTLALTTDDMEHSLRLEILDWVRNETRKRGVSPSDLLRHLRNEVRTQVLGETPPGDK